MTTKRITRGKLTFSAEKLLASVALSLLSVGLAVVPSNAEPSTQTISEAQSEMMDKFAGATKQQNTDRGGYQRDSTTENKAEPYNNPNNAQGYDEGYSDGTEQTDSSPQERPIPPQVFTACQAEATTYFKTSRSDVEVGDAVDNGDGLYDVSLRIKSTNTSATCTVTGTGNVKFIGVN